MTQMLYLDCFSGASGDMMLGALLDLGVPLDGLRAALGGLLPPGCDVTAARVQRGGIEATQFRLEEAPPSAPADGHGHHRHLSAIVRMIEGTTLGAGVKEKAIALFRRLGEAEAAIHGVPVEKIHFHEVGALDSIVDIVGAAWAFDQLGVAEVVASPLNVGSGTVATAHGRLPVPAPATLRLLEGAPVYSTGVPLELVTPTGALLVTGYASRFAPMPAMTPRRTGYGAGGRQIEGQPNVLRAILGDTAASSAMAVSVLECNIDDMNPQLFGVVLDRLYGAGALEVFFTPIQMKKNRPGTLLTVIAAPAARGAALDVLFQETTTIGVRHHQTDRECLDREIVPVHTPYGDVRMKVSRRNGAVMTASPEFDDCARLASERDVPVKEVQAAAVSAYRR